MKNVIFTPLHWNVTWDGWLRGHGVPKWGGERCLRFAHSRIKSFPTKTPHKQLQHLRDKILPGTGQIFIRYPWKEPNLGQHFRHLVASLAVCVSSGTFPTLLSLFWRLVAVEAFRWLKSCYYMIHGPSVSFSPCRSAILSRHCLLFYLKVKSS